MMTLLKLRKGEYSIVEEKVHPKAVVVGKMLRDIRAAASMRLCSGHPQGTADRPQWEHRACPGG